MAQKVLVTPSPHLKSEEDVGAIMKAVCLALVPAYVFALYRFGWWSWAVAALAVAACVLTEILCQRLRRQPVTVDDGSAVVTGLLLAAVLPPNVAWFVPVVGGVVGVGVAKHAFGGLGSNIWNPALLGRAFLQAAFPGWISSGTWPATRGETFTGAVTTSLRGSFESLAERAAEAGTDVVTGATPLERLATVGVEAGEAPVWVRDGVIRVAEGFRLDVFLGNIGGSLGEVSALALLFGVLYLLGRRIISWHIPLSYAATVALLTWALPAPYRAAGGATAYTHWFSGPWLLHLAAGGLVIGAGFMATDMVTSPMTKAGQLIFGVGCGLLTAVIRLYGGYPEGVCYSILLMNTVVPLIDAWCRPRAYGTGGGQSEQPAAV